MTWPLLRSLLIAAVSAALGGLVVIIIGILSLSYFWQILVRDYLHARGAEDAWTGEYVSPPPKRTFPFTAALRMEGRGTPLSYDFDEEIP